MTFYFVECMVDLVCVERSHLYTNLETCIKLADEKARLGYEVSIERIFYDEQEDNGGKER